MDGRRWAGEDPQPCDGEHGVTVAADNEQRLARVLQALRGAGAR